MNQKTILIVDDSEFDRELFKRALAKSGGFSVLEAESGERCFELLGERKVDLILMDILMPGEIGTEVLLKVRAQFNAVLLPIIMVTSKSDVSEVITSLHRGANDYITKPVNFEVAISRINTHLKLADVSKEMIRLKEIATLDAMITTYNHEINNPLSIAIGCLSDPEIKKTVGYLRLEEALWRVADIVKKIEAVSEKKEIEYQQYAGFGKMLKVR